MNFSRRLKVLLQEKNTSAAQICEKSGISRSLFSKYLNDPDINPSVDAVERLAKAFDISMAYFFGEAPTVNEMVDDVLVYRYNPSETGQDRHTTEGTYVKRELLLKAGVTDEQLGDLELIYIEDDTMRPIVRRGDQIICVPMPETNPEEYIDNGCIYVFTAHSHTFCGYLQRNFDGSIGIWTEQDAVKQRVAIDAISILFKVVVRIGAI